MAWGQRQDPTQQAKSRSLIPWLLMRNKWITYLFPILNRTVIISTFAATNGWTAQIKNPSLRKIIYMIYQQDPIPVP